MSDRQLHDYWEPPMTAASGSLIGVAVAAQQDENRAAARRLAAVGELFEMRRAQRGEADEWAVDTWAAVGAEVAAALRISLGRAGSTIGYGLAMRRLPAVSAVFAAGDIDLAMFATIVYRTELVTDDDARARIDALLAAALAGWSSLSRGKLAGEIDRLIATTDPDAVRRTRDRVREREVSVWHNGDGTADISARLLSTDAHSLDERLDTLAATVCPLDPRTKAQRRADALGALAAGADRLACRCEAPDCPAAAGPPPSPVVIHVVAEAAALSGDSARPAYLLGARTVIPAEVLREATRGARRRPLTEPADGPGEPRYRPSRSLADFIRARDLTCRAPGCNRPATHCDVDHTIPWAAGGPTHAGNMKSLCRLHHLLKTFWGWKDRQETDGTVIWTLPGGQIHTTVPGSARLFPALCTPTPTTNAASPRRASPSRGDRTTAMPRRTTTRERNRAHAIAAERNRNHRYRTRTALATGQPEVRARPPDDDPPF